ncbi:MAG TPA: IS982 family transposase [Chitinophagaceae bacterium]|nr:IS982 family transposase [Chitinophagaceae bacterium]HML58832.1 IS982 family transposase [Ferruginibacter sp.]
MHNIKTNFGRIYRICKEFFEGEVNTKGNFQFYPKATAMADLEIVALACTMEALGIDSENLLWSKLKKDYPTLFNRLICRTRFNRRRRRLQPYIVKIQDTVSKRLENQSQAMVIDSIPVPVVKMARERTYKAFRKSFDTAPAKGYSAVNRGWFIGYKLHVVIFDNGVVQQSGVTKGNIHDINYLKGLRNLPSGKLLLGDRAYRSNSLQMDLFDNFKVKLRVPFRINQHEYKKHPKKYKSKRQMVETFFAQMCDQLNLKRNYAKSFDGLVTRLTSKLSAMSILHWINYLNGRKLAQIKHALSF